MRTFAAVFLCTYSLTATFVLVVSKQLIKEEKWKP